MAKAANTRKKPRRGKAKPKRAVALHSAPAALRKKLNESEPDATSSVDTNQAIAISRSMSGIMSAYIELPAKLMQCRTPFGVWREQALLAGRVLDLLERGFAPERSPRA